MVLLQNSKNMKEAEKIHNEKQLDYYEHKVDDYEKAGVLQRATNRAFKRKSQIIANTINKKKVGSILEVGAGSGLLTYFAINDLSFDRYVVQDLAHSMIEMAKKRVKGSGLEFSVGDANFLDFPDNTFDAVIGTDIIHHLDNPVKTLTEWRRVTKPNGRICILESNTYNPLNLRNIGVEHEVRSFLNTDRNLKIWLEKAGWAEANVPPAPAFTPAGPAFLSPVFDFIDWVSPKIPVWNKLSALWIVTAVKH